MSDVNALALLGAAMQSDVVRSQVLTLLRPEDFQTNCSRALMRWLIAYAEGGGVAGIGPEVEAAQHASVARAGIAAEWAEAMTADAIPATAAGWYIRQVQLEAAQARVREAAVHLAALGARRWETQDDLSAAVAEVVQAAEVAPGRGATVSKLGERWAEERARRSAGGARVERVPTGVDELDDLLNGGMAPGQLVVVGGRPAMGKTALGVQIALHASACGFGVGMCSMEMTAVELDVRAVSSISFVPARSIERDDLTTDQAEQVTNAEELIKSLPFMINDRPRMTVGQVMTQARIWKAGPTGLSLLIIDHLHIMDHGKADRNDLAMAHTTGVLKVLAKTLGCSVLLLAQLSRAYEKRKGDGDGAGWRGSIARPLMSDLRDAGSIEQDADVVMFPLRPTGELASVGNANEAQIEVVKHRGGPTGIVETGWDGPCTTFRLPPAPDDLLP
jgi:replicative DNA helicase